jgi:diguanylate cyclase (GGDEF)-like protein/PAS domain S-box-containing protein
MGRKLLLPVRAGGAAPHARGAPFLARLRHSPALQMGLLFALLLPALWTGIAFELRSSLRQVQRESLQDTRNLLRLYAEEVRSSIYTIDLTLLNLRDRWQDEGLERFADRVRQRRMNLEHSVAFQIAIIDAQGRLAFSSNDAAAAPIDLSDREHFKVHRYPGAEDFLFVSKPVLGRISGRWSVQFTRRLQDPQGGFAGVIVLSISPDYFTRFSRSIDLGRDSTVTVVRTTGELVTRSPIPSQGLDIKLQEIPQQLARLAEDQDSFEKVSDVDGKRRQFVLRTVPGYDLAVVMGQSIPVLLEPYQRQRRAYLMTGVVISALLVLFGNVLLSGLRQRTRAHAALEQSEFRWKYALEGAGDGVWDWDLRTDIVYFSPRWKSMLGYAVQDIGNRPEDWRGLLHPEDEPPTVSALQDYLAGRAQEYAVEFRMRARDGDWRWIHSRGVAVHRDAQARPQRLIGTHEDITERKLAEEAMQLALLVYEYSSEGMLVMDADDAILTVNRAFTVLTGYESAEVVGRTTDFLLRASAPDDASQHETLWREVRATGHWQGEVWSRRKDGGVYAEWLSINTILDRDGKPHRRVALFSDLAHKKEYEQIIWQQAHCDPLTGLLNRRIFRERLERDIHKAGHAGRTMALLFLDLDHFKEVNDTLGHSVGDALLQEAAQRLRGCVRAGDSVARLGGDEFTVMTDTDDPVELARAILQRMNEPFVLGLETAFISASIGITYYPRDGATAETLLRDADQAMYAAKGLGRNRYQEFTSSMHEAAQQRMRLAGDLRGAVAGGQLRVVYQPIVELATGSIHKGEALVRWEHPVRGTISPAEFIPVAEQTGVIHAIGDWVFHEVVPRLAQLRRTHHPHFQMSLNKSPAQFVDDYELYKEWLRELEAQGLPGSSIALEITEGLLLEANAAGGLKEKMARFREAGVQLSLDDFGTGYSSLSYLKKFDIDYLKIDQSFVRNLAEGSSELALCRAIIAMAHALGLRVIAEGIETPQQRDLLAAIGCDYGQGYWFSRPVPFEALEALLAEARRLP